MKFNTDTQRGKLQHAIWKNHREISNSINNIFQKENNDKDITIMSILSLLIIFPVLTRYNIKFLCQINPRSNVLDMLKNKNCVRFYNQKDPEFQIKKISLPNLYEKEQIIECINCINSIYNGAYIDIKKINEIIFAQKERRKNKYPLKIHNNITIIEITDKGKTLLRKYLDFYSNLGIINNVDKLRNKLKNDSGLLSKSIDELKHIVNEKDIIDIIVRSNFNEKLVAHKN